MTRFDDLGLAGYEWGEGYRPEGITLRGMLSAFASVALIIAGLWLVRDAIGQANARFLQGMALAALIGWSAVNTLRRPLAGDEYATDEERNKVRRDSVWSFVVAAICAGTAVLIYVQHGGHSR